MAGDVRRMFLDSCAPQHANEPFTAERVCEAAHRGEVPGVPVGATMVDVGCGAGCRGVQLARRGTVGSRGRRPVRPCERETVVVVRRPAA